MKKYIIGNVIRGVYVGDTSKCGLIVKTHSEEAAREFDTIEEAEKYIIPGMIPLVRDKSKLCEVSDEIQNR